MTSQSGWTSTSWSKPLSCYYDQDCETRIFKHLWARPSMIWLGNPNNDFNGGHKVISRRLAISMVPLGSALLVDQIPGIVNDQSAQAWFPGVIWLGNVNKLLRPSTSPSQENIQTLNSRPLLTTWATELAMTLVFGKHKVLFQIFPNFNKNFLLGNDFSIRIIWFQERRIWNM